MAAPSQSIGAAASHRFDLEMEGITMLVTGHRAFHKVAGSGRLALGGKLFPKLMYVVVKTEFVVPAPRNASKLGWRTDKTNRRTCRYKPWFTIGGPEGSAAKRRRGNVECS